MDGILRQSTAVTLKIGPFLDVTNGDDRETALTIAQADVRLSKNGGNYAQKNDATACTHDEIGEYDCPLNTTDTNTNGILKLSVDDAAALPVWHTYQVIAQAVYDQLFGASAAGAATVSMLTLVDSGVNVIQSDSIIVESSVQRVESQTTDIHSDSIIIESSVQAIEAGGGSLTVAQDSKLTQVHSESAVIQSDAAIIEASVQTIESQTTRIESNTEAIHSQTTAIESDSIIIESNTAALENAAIIDQGTAVGVTGTTIQLRAGATFADDELIDALVVIVSATTGAGQVRQITDYVGATDTATVSTWTTTPTGTIEYAVIPAPTNSALTGSQDSKLTQVHSESAVIQSDTALLELSRGIIDEGTAQSVTATTIQLRAGATFANDEIIGATVVITDATTGKGQARQITDYVGATDTATVPVWTTTPTGTIQYQLFGTPDVGALSTSQDSKLTKISSEASVIQSDVARIESDSIIIESSIQVAESQTTVVESLSTRIQSNTEAIHSQTTIIESDSVKIESSIDVVESDTTAIEAGGGSLTVAQDSKLTKISSETTVLQSDSIAIESSVQAVESQTTRIESNTEAIHSQTTTIESDSIIIESSVQAIEAGGGSLTAAQDSKLTQVHSESAVIQSDSAIIESSVQAVESQTTRIESNTEAIHSQTTTIESDSIRIESNTDVLDQVASDSAIIESSVQVAESSVQRVESQTTVIESDSIRVESLVDKIDGDTNAIKSDTAVIESDTSRMESGLITGTFQTGTLTVSSCTTDLTGFANDQLNGRVIVITSGNAEGEVREISDYALTNGQVSFASDLTTAPANGDFFKIV